MVFCILWWVTSAFYKCYLVSEELSLFYSLQHISKKMLESVSFRRVRSPHHHHHYPKRNILAITIRWIWWWGSSFRTLGIAIIPRSTPTLGVMFIIIGNEHSNLSSRILEEAVCISYRANTLGKGMNSSIFPPAMSK